MKESSKPKPVIPDKIPEGMKLLGILRGHTKEIFGIDFSPDGKEIATASEDKTIKIWDLNTKTNTSTISGHNKSVLSVKFSPDGKNIFSCSDDSLIRLWNKDSEKLIKTFKGHTGGVKTIDISPDGKLLASGSDDYNIILWDINRGSKIKWLKFHKSIVTCVEFSPDGNYLVSGSEDNSIAVWDIKNNRQSRYFTGHSDSVYSISLSPDGTKIATASSDKTIKIWDFKSCRLLHVMEDFTKTVVSCIFSKDRPLLISLSDSIKIANEKTLKTILNIHNPCSDYWPQELALHPTKPILAAHGENDMVVNLWELDFEVLSKKDFVNDSVPYTTARIALVGDSGVGKTGLGWRIAHGKFKEHSSTHGQQFWVIDELCKKRKDGAECEAVLWDLAGQQDYRLVHALFLEDIDLAMVLFDPGNREKPLSGVEYWLKQLKNAKNKDLKIILIGARIDRGKPTITKKEFDEFCSYHDIQGGYLPTSAKEGEGISSLMAKLKDMIPWDDMPATITTSTFKRVKQFVLDLKEETEHDSVLVSPEILRSLLEETDSSWEFTDAEMMTAVKHLENHGYVTICSDSNGEQFILLYPDILVNLASSFVLEARGNPQGLGVLEEKKLLTGEYRFPDLKHIKNADEKEILLDSAAVLFLKQNLCFRETLEGAYKRSLLVFPSLINEKRPKTGDIETEDDVSYIISGSVENVYASMVVLLGYTDHFTRKNQWQNQAQYELREDEVCGFRQISEHEGEIEITLYYNDRTPPNGRLLFQGLFETFLLHRDINIIRYESVICPECKERQERASVMNQIKKGRKIIHCSNCGLKINIPETTELTPIDGVDRKTISYEQNVVKRRTDFETALIRIKGILREREEKEGVHLPSCFISYSWGTTEHEKWVLQLAKDLQNADIDVLFDKWDNVPGASITKFIDKIDQADFALAVGTKLYLEKYKTESSDPVVDAEIRMIQTRLRKKTRIRETVIPLLLEGTQKGSFPPQFEDSVFIDFTENKNYFVELFRLIMRLYNIPFDHPGLDELIETMKPGD